MHSDVFRLGWEQLLADFNGFFEDSIEEGHEDDKKSVLSRIGDKGKSTEDTREDEDEVDEGLDSDDRSCQRQMNSYRRGWKAAFGGTFGSFEDNTLCSSHALH
ncbi:hypothetical protein ACP4OV_024257 [Aristida adscensionis]